MEDFLVFCMLDLVSQIVESNLENYFETLFMMVY